MKYYSNIIKIFLVTLSVFTSGCQAISYTIERNSLSDEVKSMSYEKTRLLRIDNSYPMFVFAHKNNKYIVINRPIGNEYILFIYKNDILFSILKSGYARSYWREAFPDNEHTPTIARFDKLITLLLDNRENIDEISHFIRYIKQSPTVDISQEHDEIVQGPVTVLMWLEFYTGLAGKTRPDIWFPLLAAYGFYYDFRIGMTDWEYKKDIRKLEKSSLNVELGMSSIEWNKSYGNPLTVITLSKDEKIYTYNLSNGYHITAGVHKDNVVWAGIGYNPNESIVP